MRPLLSLLSNPPPCLELGQFPAPLEWREDEARSLGFESLCVKRDDLNAPRFGGNKVRALEWLLPAAGPSVVTFGGYGSTHAAATAIYAREVGRLACVALFPQPWTETVPVVLLRTLAYAPVFLAPSRSTLPLALVRAWREAASVGRPTWIPAGGASPLGVLGSVNAALELVQQVEGASAARPDAVVVPLGTGGTAAGLLVGLALAGWPTRVCAVPVTDRWMANAITVHWLAHRAQRLLARHGVRVLRPRGRLRILPGQLGLGYGHPTAAGLAARDSAGRLGLSLDLTYGAKAWAALQTLTSSCRRPCFWHTFDSRPAAPAPADDPLLRRAREYSEALWPYPRST